MTTCKQCHYCATWVNIIDGVPVSKYYNMQHHVLFCSAKCSLDSHQINYAQNEQYTKNNNNANAATTVNNNSATDND